MGPPGITWSHGRAQPPSEEHHKAEDLEDLVASRDLPSVESLEDRGALTPTVASLAALLPAKHIAAWEAITPINAADQGVTATTTYYPMANKRAELAIKAAKMIITGNLGPQGTLDTDRFARALLEHRTSPRTQPSRDHHWQQDQLLPPS